MKPLDGRVLVVTGAGRGLGREHARYLAAAGASVVVNDLGCERDGTGGDPSVAEAVAEEVRAAGGRAVASGHDVADSAGADAVVQLAIDEFGALHGLVNSAGVLRDRMFVNLDDDDWDSCIRGHLRTVFAPTQAAARYWREQHKNGVALDATVVSMSSTSGLIGQVGQSNYGAAKAAIAALTVIVAKELERYGVKVNALTPVARTRMTEETPGVADLVKAPDSATAFDVFHPANVSPLVAVLSSSSCPVTGEVFYVRGEEVRHFLPWQYGEVWTTTGAWEPDVLEKHLSEIESGR
jgi:NAD(P)-dependent dehydrogenase (short-subunit alcohol dehydrogenase family)